MVYLTRKAEFSASHYYHNPDFTLEENRRVFGKCNNPNGHGHNYLLEVTIAGPIDPATGMVFDLVALDRLVAEHVLEKLDHMNLNLDVETFRAEVPTTENLCRDIYNRLYAPLKKADSRGQAHLERVRLEETRLNSFECVGEHPGAIRE